jgi:hypothetical protein
MISTRTIQDFDLTVTTALPAAAANADSASIDLEATGPAALESVELEIILPATPSLTEDDTITLTIQDSADDSTFSAIEELATLVVTGAAAAAGGPAATRKYRLPSSTRRYINVNAAVLTGGGDNTAVSYTWRLLS